MEPYIPISNLNDFIFCPISIYFHNLYGNMDNRTYQKDIQIKGKQAHEAVDNQKYSNKKSVLQGLDVYSEDLQICGKIDTYDFATASLVERKRKINQIYDGYIFQVYAEYYCMVEMGYKIDNLYLYSLSDNKKYPIHLPEGNVDMKNKFFSLIHNMNNFDINEYQQTNTEKCKNCIYNESCDRGLL